VSAALAAGVSYGAVAVIAGAALVVAMALLVIDLLGTSSPEAWSAAAAWTTASLALGATRVAFTQVRETRALRVEQAQPYVAVAIEPLIAVDPKLQELVVKNFRATAAFNVP